MTDKTQEELDKILKELYDDGFGDGGSGDGYNFSDPISEAKHSLELLIEDRVRSAEQLIADWATGNDNGTSSQAIMRHMLGLEANHWGFMSPSDEDDRGRCIRLLQKFPEWIARLDEMSKYPGWSEQIPLIKVALQTDNKKEGV